MKFSVIERPEFCDCDKKIKVAQLIPDSSDKNRSHALYPSTRYGSFYRYYQYVYFNC